MPLQTGQIVLDRYRIIRLLGQGGFGAVYQAWDINLDRPCALKENLETTGEMSRQFEREARLLANLSHPNLPRVTDHFRINQQGQYLVMDYVEGIDLEGMVTGNRAPLALNLIVGWINQVGDALAYLHRQDPPIIHRDIKPANIRITPTNRAVLVDFGIAKLYNPSVQTTVGARAITPGYSPPEQYGRGSTDARSDVFALGATIYTLLTAKVPPDSLDVLTGAAQKPKPIHEINADVPLSFSQVVMKAMNVDRLARYASVDEFVASLRSALSIEFVAPNHPIFLQPNLASGLTPQDRVGIERTSRSPIGEEKSGQVSKPASTSKSGTRVRTIAYVGAGSLVLGFTGLVGVLVLIYWLLNSQVPNTPRGVTEIPSVVTDNPIIPKPSETFSPTDTLIPTNTPPPTQTPSKPTPVGALAASVPESYLAFSSDHHALENDQVFIRKIQGGEYLFVPNDDLFRDDPEAQNSPLGPINAVPLGSGANLAWWPDWCMGERVLLFEAQNTHDPSYQTIFKVDNPVEGMSNAIPITWPDSVKIGVPRCSNHNDTAVASGLEALSGNRWRLHKFSLANPGFAELIGDGFPFSGFASWAGNDGWFLFMHSEAGGPFTFFQMSWDQEGIFHPVSVPEGAAGSRFPAVSPVDERIAYACPQTDTWGLCVQNMLTGQVEWLVSGLAPIKSIARGEKPAFAAVTPVWSPDGAWLAYSSNRDGDWDIYIYNLKWKIDYNITQDLGGDQFHPAWSKP